MTNKLTTEEFTEKAIKVHGGKYDYSLVEYKLCHTKVKIICPTHGMFEQVHSDHLKGCGCPSCKSSKGENQLEECLKGKNIYYISEKRFKSCKDIKPLPFDFYLPEYNTCIEYDGEQHFMPIKFNNMSDEKAVSNSFKVHHNDYLKSAYCFLNNIKLIRIPYWEYKNIEKILKEELWMH